MKALRIPVFVLLMLLLIGVFSAVTITRQKDRWTSQLDSMESAAIQGDWAEADRFMSTLEDDWEAWQTYLHVVAEHQEIDVAENLLQLCRLHCDEQDTAALRVAVSQLRFQLSVIAETEAFSIKNIL